MNAERIEKLTQLLGSGVRIESVLEPKEGQIILIRMPSEDLAVEELHHLSQLFEPATTILLPSDVAFSIDDADQETLAKLGLQRIPA